LQTSFHDKSRYQKDEIMTVYDGTLSQLNIKRIAVLRALQLGDLLCSVPAFRALKTALPETEITLVGLPWAFEFVQRFRSYLDGFIPFPGFPDFPEQVLDVGAFPRFLIEMQKRSFDLVIQMQGSGGVANSLVSLLGGREAAGFYLPGQYRPNESYFLQYPEDEPEPRRHLRLMEFLGVPLQGEELEFPLSSNDWAAFRQIRDDFKLQKNYVCVHAGARAVERRWPAAYFAAVADQLAALGYQVVLTGSREERDVAASVAQNMKAPSIELAGKTSLGALAALVSQARLVFSNDTGISHLAAAVRTPSVVLFSASEPHRWAPLNQQLHKIVPHAMSMAPAEILGYIEKHLQEGSIHA
jgi:ADP-heptose:LPS heptosyltransferase